MQVDPVSGKGYLTEWERDLAQIQSAGFSCGYIQLKDLATGELLWQVDAQKGNGPRVAVRMADLSEAVNELKRLLFRTHRNYLPLE